MSVHSADDKAQANPWSAMIPYRPMTQAVDGYHQVAIPWAKSSGFVPSHEVCEPSTHQQAMAKLVTDMKDKMTLSEGMSVAPEPKGTLKFIEALLDAHKRQLAAMLAARKGDRRCRVKKATNGNNRVAKASDFEYTEFELIMPDTAPYKLVFGQKPRHGDRRLPRDCPRRVQNDENKVRVPAIENTSDEMVIEGNNSMNEGMGLTFLTN
ncbi:uncharacterized protein N7515_003232 [Penicillium bovifimosum]|uniref:Uncharacterized protein n=1 Tax=Penicillium bovifimosum TaxID=126998 RepID=A0A9W9H495_9EURO|nr:uncharacterized protein N7515_003232 [Penicillium bovifimosum]KAJ5138384.1 hypothetical protein N7515_003232 [Penicillium bovifimosum]